MSEEEEYDYSFKVVIVGDSGVGKSNLLSRYDSGSFHHNTKATIGVELCTKVVEVEGKRIQNQIWDTAGQERFKAMASAYYRSAVGAIIVFDLTNLQSFQNVAKWLNQLHEHSEPSIATILVGNKSDLPSRAVNSNLIDDFVMLNKLNYLETSALTGQNVAQAFQSLIAEIYQKQRRSGRRDEGGVPHGSGLTKITPTRGETTSKTKINQQEKKVKKSGCC